MFPDISSNASTEVWFPVCDLSSFSTCILLVYHFSVKYHSWPRWTTLLCLWDYFSMQSIIHIVWHSVILSYLIKYHVYSLNYIQDFGWSTNHPRYLLQNLNITLKMIYNILRKLLNVKERSIYYLLVFINLIFKGWGVRVLIRLCWPRADLQLQDID